MEQIKAYKFRIYPNETQKELIEKTFGCTRFVYNQRESKNSGGNLEWLK